MLLKYIGTSALTNVTVGNNRKIASVVEGDIIEAEMSDYKNLLNLYGDLFVAIEKISPEMRDVVTVATADVLTLNATPVQLVAAPGAGKALVVDKIVASVDFNSAAYDTNTTIEYRYTNGAGAKVANDDAVTLAASADSIVVRGDIDATVVANSPVVVTVATGDPANGDSDIQFDVVYRIVDIAA